MKKRLVRAVGLVSVILFVGGLMLDVAQAMTLKVANLQNLVEQADRIFVGESLSVANGMVQNIPFSAHTFRIVDSIKGVGTGTVIIKQFGVMQPMPIGNGLAVASRIAGMPRYQPEQEFLLFVVPESLIGLSSPAGLFQGAFLVLGSGDHKKLINGVNNQNIARGLSASWLQAHGLTFSEVEQLMNFTQGPLDYQFFVQIVKKLSQTP